MSVWRGLHSSIVPDSQIASMVHANCDNCGHSGNWRICMQSKNAVTSSQRSLHSLAVFPHHSAELSRTGKHTYAQAKLFKTCISLEYEGILLDDNDSHADLQQWEMSTCVLHVMTCCSCLYPAPNRYKIFACNANGMPYVCIARDECQSRANSDMNIMSFTVPDVHAQYAFHSGMCCAGRLYRLGQAGGPHSGCQGRRIRLQAQTQAPDLDIFCIGARLTGLSRRRQASSPLPGCCRLIILFAIEQSFMQSHIYLASLCSC